MLYGGSTVILSNILDYEIYELGIWFLTERRQEMIKSFDVAELSALLGAAGLGWFFVGMIMIIPRKSVITIIPRKAVELHPQVE